jgi:RNA 2',3'-cyclic 3'-phosphodiesterase
MARLFTAVELEPEIRDRIADVQSRMARSLDTGRTGLRLVRPAQLHLTLVFLGEIEDSRVPAVVAAMSDDLPVATFDIEFSTAGVFPPRGPARVLWIGVRRGARELTRLFDAVSDRLTSVGLPRETRPFAPHLTLGRWRDRGAKLRPSVLPDIGTVGVQTVSSVTLFRSRLLPEGPEHSVLAHAPLRG